MDEHTIDRLSILRSFFEHYEYYHTGNSFYSTLMFSNFHKKYTIDNAIVHLLSDFLNYKIKLDQLYTELKCVLCHLEIDESILENYETNKRYTELFDFITKNKNKVEQSNDDNDEHSKQRKYKIIKGSDGELIGFEQSKDDFLESVGTELNRTNSH